MPGTSPGMTANFAARGVLKRRCADGKTPLSRAPVQSPRGLPECVPAGESRETPRPFLAICTSRAADPHSLAGPHGRSRHRPLRLFAGAAGHARYAGLVLFRRRLHEHHQCRGLSGRRLDGVESHQALRIVRRRALGNRGFPAVAGALRLVGQFCRSEPCAAARGVRGCGRLRRRGGAGRPDRASATRAGEFSAQPVLRRARARHPGLGAGRALRAAGLRPGIVVDRVVGDDAACHRPDHPAAADAARYQGRHRPRGVRRIRASAGIDLSRRLFSVRRGIHRLHDLHDCLCARCRRRRGGAERVLVPDRRERVRHPVAVARGAGAQQWRPLHR